MLDLSFPDLLDIAFAHVVTQSEIQGKVRDALNEQLQTVELVGVRSDPDSVPVDQYGLPTWSPLDAPMVINERTVGEMDDLLTFLKTPSKDRETGVDPLLGGGDS